MRNTAHETRRASRRGMVLVASVGVLGVLSVMAMAFATVMRLEARAARNFTNAVRAEFVARAGIEDAMARLRAMVRDGAELPYENGRPASWYTWRGTAGGGTKISFPATEATNGLDDDGDGLVDRLDADELETDLLSYSDWTSSSLVDGGDNYTLSVQDAASKINVNAGDNLGVILDNLCRVVGPPLVAADQRALVPTWFADTYRQYRSPYTTEDTPTTQDFFYRLDGDDRPVTDTKGKAVFGDGYAIAGYRARHGAFLSIDDVRNALTYTERAIDGDNDGDVEADTPEERMEIEAKFAAIRPYLTIDSWTDTDQIGCGKFEHVHTNGAGSADRLVDRNKTWNTSQNDGEGELKGCYVAIVNGIGQGQLKTIARNTIDTIFLDNSQYPGSEMLVPPDQQSSYMIIGKDHRYDSNVQQWYNEARLYSKHPLSFHRAPVNVNTATDKVLVALILGLQTNWGPAGYYANEVARAVTADWHSLTPSVLAIGRDGYNAHLRFDLPCPNDSRLATRMRDPNLAAHGHPNGGPPYCWFCNHGRSYEGGNPGTVSEAHCIAWQILKEREQTAGVDERYDTGRAIHSNGYGPFRGWDDLYFRVFRPWERGSSKELCLTAPRLDRDVPRVSGTTASYSATLSGGSGSGHPGIARLCMANFNSNTDILKFQPNIEWINRWGANFTDLYLPDPSMVGTGTGGNWGTWTYKDLKLRVRPGELLDKTDLNIGTTEFTFDSGGVYEVRSTGRVYDADGMVAEKKFAALVRIYDVWRESTQREFVAGTISNAEGAAGSHMSGQIAADGVSQTSPGGGPVRRKGLCTYPEPVVPGSMRGPNGNPVPLALDKLGINVKPAGFDGQILLATNSMMGTPNENPDPTITFYDSFTGQVSADFAMGDPEAKVDLGNRMPVDEVGLLGAINNTEFDVNPIRDVRTGKIVEGEGKGGDLRPDGLYLGIVGTARLDGSFGFDAKNNMHYGGRNEGTISMWVKPTWHHGTYMRPTLPVNYDNNPAHEKGSTVPIKRYANWPGPMQRYTNEADRVSPGYVRERFEHEFFSATIPGVGYGAHGFQINHYGDEQNSGGSFPFGSLFTYIEDNHDSDFRNFIPGYLHPLTGKPYYVMCPYRWFYLGLIWNYRVSGRADHVNRSTGDPDCQFGLPFEDSGASLAGYAIESGYEYGDEPYPGSTGEDHLSLVLLGRVFVDTMRTFNRSATSFPGDDMEAKLQAWAYEQYGTNYNKGVFPMVNRSFDEFGVNRARPEGEHLYQKRFSGTYGTIDELTITNHYRDPRNNNNGGYLWTRETRKIGRYYFDKTGRKRPYFISQSLFSSESAQTYKFSDSQRDEEIELGTVRWTVFTPYFCLHQPGLSEYEFPYDSYFMEHESSSRSQSVSQSYRPGRNLWKNGPQSRNSSARGCTVSVVSGRSKAPTESAYEYLDPEAWSPILSRGGRSGTHARATPQGLQYVVHFGLSQEEQRRASADAVLLDSPVFDDITITYMRRPKILMWKDMSD